MNWFLLDKLIKLLSAPRGHTYTSCRRWGVGPCEGNAREEILDVKSQPDETCQTLFLKRGMYGYLVIYCLLSCHVQTPKMHLMISLTKYTPTYMHDNNSLQSSTRSLSLFDVARFVIVSLHPCSCTQVHLQDLKPKTFLGYGLYCKQSAIIF